MKKVLFYLVFLGSILASFGQNLLDTSSWVQGSGIIPTFGNYGGVVENSRVLGTGPYGLEKVIWEGKPDLSGGPDGGFLTTYLSIDHTKTYRFSVWMKKTNSIDGTIYFSLDSKDGNDAFSALALDGTNRTNAFFWRGDLPSFDTWHLFVGYINQSNTTVTTTLGGIYNGETGIKVLDIVEDWKFSNIAVKAHLEAFLFDSGNIDDRLYIYDPRIDIVNGNEPSLADLLAGAISDNNTASSYVWDKNGDNVFYNEVGNIGIGTTSPDMRLTVKGKIHAEEVKIDLSVPAPDYVFKDDYQLLTLKEIQNYINTHGHLPKIPSAREMEENGVELGAMEMKLLEKIEELTLYIIGQDKKLNKTQSKYGELEERLAELELLIKQK